jgi:putative endonuclease
MGAFVYMLKCADNSYYVGSATGDDLSMRIAQHQSGAFMGYTWSRRPVVLVWSEYFDRITDAICSRTPNQGLESRQEGSVDQVRLVIAPTIGETSRRTPKASPVILGREATASPSLEG